MIERDKTREKNEKGLLESAKNEVIVKILPVEKEYVELKWNKYFLRFIWEHTVKSALKWLSKIITFFCYSQQCRKLLKYFLLYELLMLYIQHNTIENVLQCDELIIVTRYSSQIEFILLSFSMIWRKQEKQRRCADAYSTICVLQNSCENAH